MILARIIKDWDYPDLLKQTPGSKGIWNNIKYTLNPVEECDYLIIMNKLSHDIPIKCPKDNVLTIIQEPFYRGINDWIINKNDDYVFFTHYPGNNKKYIISHPCVPWHINKTYDELIKLKIPEKNKNISFITSNKNYLKIHRKRLKFLNYVKNKNFDIDIYGKGINFIKDKYNGLKDYKYSIAIENCYLNDFWTEKLFDCFLAYTLPIYYGCPNLEKYFPEKSFIKIDIDKPEEALNIINNAIKNNEWKKRLSAIKKARNLLLNEYQFFPYISNYISKNADIKKKEKLLLKKYKYKFNIFSIIIKFINLLNRIKTTYVR